MYFYNCLRQTACLRAFYMQVYKNTYYTNLHRLHFIQNIRTSWINTPLIVFGTNLIYLNINSFSHGT